MNEAFHSWRVRYQDAPEICSLKLHREVARLTGHLVSSFGTGVATAGPLDGFQADFSFLLGTDSTDPNNAAALGAGRCFIEDKFDHLTTPKVETSAQPEAF